MATAPEFRDPTSAGRRTIFILCLAGSAILTVFGCCMSAVNRVQEDSERCCDEQFFVATALHSYHDAYGRFPPVAVYDEQGQALYSWRVLLLPFIEQQNLFKEFHLHEAWDSPHNIKLLPKMPSSYAAPGRQQKLIPSGHTVLHVFVGKGAAFEGKQGLRFPLDFRDEPTPTILVVDAGKPTPWTKPEDLEYHRFEPLPELKGLFAGGFWVCTVAERDGRIGRRWIKSETSEATLRALITRNGNDKPGDD